MNKITFTAGKIARRIAEKGESGSVIGVFSQGIYCKVKEKENLSDLEILIESEV